LRCSGLGSPLSAGEQFFCKQCGDASTTTLDHGDSISIDHAAVSPDTASDAEFQLLLQEHNQTLAAIDLDLFDLDMDETESTQSESGRNNLLDGSSSPNRPAQTKSHFSDVSLSPRSDFTTFVDLAPFIQTESPRGPFSTLSSRHAFALEQWKMACPNSRLLQYSGELGGRPKVTSEKHGLYKSSHRAPATVSKLSTILARVDHDMDRSGIFPTNA